MVGESKGQELKGKTVAGFVDECADVAATGSALGGWGGREGGSIWFVEGGLVNVDLLWVRVFAYDMSITDKREQTRAMIE